MQIAIVGCGLIGMKRAKALRNATLVACVDIDIAKAEQFSKNNQGIPFFDNVEKMFSAVQVDIVILSTPHSQLPDLLRKSVILGKHVLVEKPAARFPEDLAGIEDLARQHRSWVRVGFNHRYHRAFRNARRLVEAGELGELYFIRARYGHGGRIGYNKEWRADPAISGGGELIDQGSHLIDLSRMFLGDFEKIEGKAVNYFWEMKVDDNAFLTLTTKSGQTAFLQVSCTEWKNTFSFEIYGKHGKLHIEGLGGSYGTEKLTFYKMLPEMGPPETTSWEYPMADDSWEVEFQEFLEDVKRNVDPSPGISDAVANLEIVNKIYKKSGYDYNA